MSFEYRKPQTTTESNNQKETQENLSKLPEWLKKKSNNQKETQENLSPDEKESQSPPTPLDNPVVPLDNVALGVIYHYKAIAVMILVYFLGPVSIFLITTIAFNFARPASAQEAESLQQQIVGWCSILVLIWLTVLITKSIQRLCRTPFEIIPEAKLFISFSWIIWFAAFLMYCIVKIIFKTIDLPMLPTIITIMLGFSSYLFLTFLSKVGEYVLPSKKGCPVTIVCNVITYLFWAAIFILDPKAIDSINTISNGESSLIGLARLFYIISGFMYLWYLNKLYKFFKKYNNNIKRIIENNNTSNYQ